MITAVDVKKAILKWPGRYQTPKGGTFEGMPVSQIAQQLRDCGWRNVPRIDAYDLRKMGLIIVNARYVGGAHAKRFCDVVVARVGMKI